MHTVIAYSSYYSFFSRFFTVVYPAAPSPAGSIAAPALVGIVCGAAAAVFIIAGIVVYMVRSNKEKKESTAQVEFNETTTSSTKLIEDVNEDIGMMAQDDEDKWIWISLCKAFYVHQADQSVECNLKIFMLCDIKRNFVMLEKE